MDQSVVAVCLLEKDSDISILVHYQDEKKWSPQS